MSWRELLWIKGSTSTIAMGREYLPYPKEELEFFYIEEKTWRFSKAKRKDLEVFYSQDRTCTTYI